jgi:unsaturated rhamnogalacturonyl hydrolase
VQRTHISIAHATCSALLVVVAASGCSSTTSVSCLEGCAPNPESDQVALATDIALRYIENHPYEDELWDWRSGVLMHALAELYLVTGDQRLHDYYQAWLDFRIEEGYEMLWSDSCPPAITAVALLKEAPADSYQGVLDDTLEYLDVTAPRTAEGGISHNGILGNRPSVWLDSLFMFGMVLNRASGLAGYEARLDMMSEQTQIFAAILQDENGFMRHAQDWPGYDESVHWARGNSWVVASLADYLRIRVERGETDPEVAQIFRDHVEAIISAQEPDSGRWLTAMSHPDEPGNYLETSASALFAYGMARAYRYGILGDVARQVTQKAIRGVQEMIIDNGDGPIVTGVSVATDPWQLRSPTGGEDGYLDVNLEDDVNYGVGAVILALIETSGLPE